MQFFLQLVVSKSTVLNTLVTYFVANIEKEAKAPEIQMPTFVTDFIGHKL